MHWSIARSLPESGIPHQLACKTHKVRCCIMFVQNTSYRTAEGAAVTQPINGRIPHASTLIF